MTHAATKSEPQDAPNQEEVDPEQILLILAKHRHARGELIAVLQDIQVRYGHLPEEALRTVADGTGRSLVDIYGIATFFNQFSLLFHLIRCHGTTAD